ncbi:hypothetical protein JW962_00765 [Candidatus Dojkabacteria bacterium]|nr:hypothetical protein [Candidatus Dojkabacteria bacterium]
MNILLLPAVENFSRIESSLGNNHTYTKGYFKDLVFKFNSEPKVHLAGKDIKEFDFVWLSSYWETRDLAYAISLYLTAHNVRHTKVEASGSKIVDHMIFNLAGISVPDTFFSLFWSNPVVIQRVKDYCSYPIVIKDIRGCRGKFANKVDSEIEFEEAIKGLPFYKKFMYQTYIPNDFDWGVLVANGKIVAGEKSFPKKGEFRNNACNGATESFVPVSEIPLEIKEIAIKSVASLCLSWGRADIIVNKDTGKPYLLEVNRYPGITKGSDEESAAIGYINYLLK